MVGLLATQTIAISRQASSGLVRQRPVPLPSRLTEEDIRVHQAFVATLGEQAIWRKYSES